MDPISRYLSEYVCQIWLRSDGRVEKRGGSTDIQTDKGTLQLYIVDSSRNGFYYFQSCMHCRNCSSRKLNNFSSTLENCDRIEIGR